MPRTDRTTGSRQSQRHDRDDERALHREISSQLASVTSVPPEAPPQARSRRGVLPDRPPADVVELLAERVGLTEEDAVSLWRKATTYTPVDAVDPYQRWWTHRCAALTLGQLLQRPIAVETLHPAEISGYAALHWALILPTLRAAHPIAQHLQSRPEEPSHLSWQLETAYVPVCITVYAADSGRWLVALNAAIEERDNPWRTVEKATTTAFGDIPWAVQRLYITAMDDVDIPAYAPQESRPVVCSLCHRWCGWDGVCRHCHPEPPLPPDPRWKELEQSVAPLESPQGDDWRVALLGHQATHAALVAMKSQRGYVTLQEAVDLVLSLQPGPLSLSRILRQAGFNFTGARAILERVRDGESLRQALLDVVGRRR